MAAVRAQLEEQDMEVDEAPDDDELRETYNFAPGYYGAVYRGEEAQESHGEEDAPEDDSHQELPESTAESGGTQDKKTRYKLQKMRWGLIPSWTKRQPNYGSMMRTINCREDSLIDDRGMWTSMKRKKRCVVVCQGFYEWLKKGPGGKERVPHYTKRKDSDLMWFAGLWDCVQYEGGVGSDEKLYTYTIITTDSNSYLKFLHDRMPVILEPGSEQMKTWLDPRQTTWTPELQSILKPYDGELDCYPVSKEVGKVGNNSPDFVVPVNSKENKNNIANFFANAKKKTDGPKTEIEETEYMHQHEQDNAPKSVPPEEAGEPPRGTKREFPSEDGDTISSIKAVKAEQPSPIKPTSKVTGRPMRSATTNKSSPRKGRSYGTSKQASDGSQRITNFFK
ncbi:uncharacterized protein TRUGW13939_08448 [Talaromyces rugulosus]|uniref:DUF159 domain protein n=1 Tax=Talaromyces rugulosus TaxID=121627 RepID=A0A7H8R4L6_TALRU|nr:uncharacterized protein TRUGW13939_08448 [Talaromyces rugulosus]QKX61300.1 hypothetical protein TRUGW13939_08448 [Talaromyces rugulosus]